MAGKSTILRSICAVALLSACGLYAPVQSAVVPYTDAFMLRNFSADSPLEGKSSFAVEMVEMRYAALPFLPLPCSPALDSEICLACVGAVNDVCLQVCDG